jgi:hypothetical protein
MRAPLGPVLDGDLSEASEVPGVQGDQYQLVDMGDRGDLAIDERRSPAECLETCSLMAVPRRRKLVIRKNWKRYLYDVVEIGFESNSALASWQPTAAVRELVPDRRRSPNDRCRTSESGHYA